MVISAPDESEEPGKTGEPGVMSPEANISRMDRFFRDPYRFVTKYRSRIRDLLRFLLVLCFLGFFVILDDIVSSSTAPLSLPGVPGVVFLTAVAALVCYLLLVRIEAEHWALVHPVFMNGLRVIRAERDYSIILLVVNLCFLAMVTISALSGYILTRSGQQFIVLLISAGAASNLMVFCFLGRREET